MRGRELRKDNKGIMERDKSGNRKAKRHFKRSCYALTRSLLGCLKLGKIYGQQSTRIDMY